jgi:hypothetical protein
VTSELGRIIGVKGPDGTTPGPWKVSDRARFVVLAPKANGKAVVVARNTQDWLAEHPLNVEADANLRLIAAAPELFELVRWAIEMDVFVADSQERAEAEALIARVEG